MQQKKIQLLLLVGVLLAGISISDAAPKRPAQNWFACTPSGDQLNRLNTGNPGAMQACRQMAQSAQAQGRSFAFMCDSTGNVACCDDRDCISVGSVAKPKLPGGVKPEHMPPGSLQQTPPPRGKPGVAPPTGGTRQPSGVR